jgi:NAD(P)H-flavin reductase
MTLRVEAPPGGARFLPGQFSMLYAFGVGEAPISICGPAPAGDEIHYTIRPVGPVTQALCETRRGHAIGVRGPFGRPWPLDALGDQDLLVVAGGVGLAPLRPALLARSKGLRSGRGSTRLVYGCRSPPAILYAREIERWRRQGLAEVRVTVDHATPGWEGEVGVVTAPLRRAALDPSRTLAFLCGPEIMMRFAARELEARGLGADRIYVSMERNMKCATGVCGHCQYGPAFVCRDGPVFRLDAIAWLFGRREI